jgi:uncharacterized protein (TIGR02453 family)
MTPWFTRDLFRFLGELARNNDRAWFQAHKAEYERAVRDPMLRFIAAAAAPLAQLAPEVVVDPRPVGGSLFRIHRDTRFSKDKSPYKTHVAAHFRHRAGRDVHAPGFYIHLAPGEVMVGAGIWHPDPVALGRIRQALVTDSTGWKRVKRSRAFRAAGELTGESVQRAPRGFDPAHPLIDDIRRKDFTVMARWAEADALDSLFPTRFVLFCRDTASLNAYLARALDLPW